MNPALSLINRFPKEHVRKAYQQLARVGLEEKASQRADELSGGQQQRVGVARALMQDPEMILADEPVASLDPVLAHSIMQYLETINNEDDVTSSVFSPLPRPGAPLCRSGHRPQRRQGGLRGVTIGDRRRQIQGDLWAGG